MARDARKIEVVWGQFCQGRNFLRKGEECSGKLKSVKFQTEKCFFDLATRKFSVALMGTVSVE